MSDHSIWILEYGYVDRFPASNLFAAQPNQGHRRMPYCFGLVRSADRCILVDTGFWDLAIHDRLTRKYGETLWQPPREIVQRAGISAEDVDTVVLTHNHFDHAGCVPDFPNAHVYIQEEEIANFRANQKLPSRFGFLLNTCQVDLPDELDRRAAENLSTLVPGAASLGSGIRLQPAFGTHTAGSQFAVVDNDADGRWIFAGDNMYQYENVEGLAGDGVMVPIAMSTGSPTTWLHTIDSVVASVDGDARRILPFHESNVWKQFPSVEFDDGLHLAEVSLAGGHPSLISTGPAGPQTGRSGG
jgi:N-acyl homoserine lactone hydrolase